MVFRLRRRDLSTKFGGTWEIFRRKNADIFGLPFVKRDDGQNTVPLRLVEKAIRGKPTMSQCIPKSVEVPRSPNQYKLIATVRPGIGPKTDLAEIVKSGSEAVPGAAVKRPSSRSFRVVYGEAYLHVEYENGENIATESDDIAEMTGEACGGATQRYCTYGDDPNMDLVNVFAFIAEDLHASGEFVLFDPIEMKLMFD